MSEAPYIRFTGLGYKNLSEMARNPAALGMEIQAAHHADVVSNVMSEEQAMVARAQIAASNRGVPSKEQKPTPRATAASMRGKIMLHKPTGRKVTIIQAAIGKEKNGEDVHQVIDAKKGKKFLVKHNDLRPLR